FNPFAGGFHGHGRCVARGEGGSHQPPGRGRRRAASDRLGHIGGQLALWALDSKAETVLMHGRRPRVGTGRRVRVLAEVAGRSLYCLANRLHVVTAPPSPAGTPRASRWSRRRTPGRAP